MENPNSPNDAASSGTFDLGKKVFFLYPPSVVKEDVVNRLLEEEFEVYMLRDHAAAKKLLKAYPDSIVFINIDDGMSEAEWRKWIKELSEDAVTAGVGVGILSYNADEELGRYYLMELGTRCGFVRLKLGAEPSTRILLSTLQANEAKGRRRYIRANCGDDKLSSVNIRHPGGTTSGSIRDISVVGFSCRLDPDPFFPKNAHITDIQMKLRGVLLKTEGIVFGTRAADGGTFYVVLFTQRLDGVSRAKIRRYIQIALQSEIEEMARSV